MYTCRFDLFTEEQDRRGDGPRSQDWWGYGESFAGDICDPTEVGQREEAPDVGGKLTTTAPFDTGGHLGRLGRRSQTLLS
eukprot:6467484-Amphidinium_carterae.1